MSHTQPAPLKVQVQCNDEGEPRLLGIAEAFQDTPLAPWSEAFQQAVSTYAPRLKHGHMSGWLEALANLPDLPISSIDLQHPDGVAILLPEHTPIPPELTNTLQALIPWRKGPYKIGPIHINTEWRSDWKWDRVEPHITSLQNRRVLDVGCGSGYHMWRMRAAGASCVLGIDPSPLFLMQFQAIQHYIDDAAVHFLPLPMESLPASMQLFDTAFSMGILYHRRDPHAHLKELKDCLRSGGEVVLETLISPSEKAELLELDGRYARMRNMWCLPSAALIMQWMQAAGFIHVRCVSVDITSIQEQRSTDWMPYGSLVDALDPENDALTIEGLPRPRRAIFIAKVP